MPELLIVLLVSWFAGFTAFLGGLFASIEGSGESHLKKQVNRGTIAFGGGLLVAAIAFALLPQGMLLLSPWQLAGAFITGGLLFALIDMQLSRRGGTRAQFMAMLMDYLPESISMGAVFVHNHRLGLLLAAFI